MSFIDSIIGFGLGSALVITVVIVVLFWLRKVREEQKPLVFLLELNKWRVYVGGRFRKYHEDILIDVEGGEYKKFWGVETDSGFVIPATGTKSDIVIQDPDYPHIIILLVSVIGWGHQEDAHKQWLNEAFPSDIYENPPQLMRVPNNYVLVSALGKRSWIQAKYTSTRALFSQFNRMATQYDRQLQDIHSGYGKFIIARIQSWNEIMVTGWEALLEGWDTTKKYNVIPLMTLCRLLHIPLSRVVYSGMSQVLQHGGMQQQAKFAGLMRQGVNELNKGFGLTAVEQPLLDAASHKVKELHDRAVQAEQKTGMYEDALRQVMQLVPGNRLPQIQMPQQVPRQAPRQDEGEEA